MLFFCIPIFFKVKILVIICFKYVGCTKEGSKKNYATYEIKEYDFAIFEFQCRMFIAKHIDTD
ncbi:MAG: hypothetical protein APF77_11815 [Clostridia bacterium BRH_c25]|nr:MAG: hypothetical protein APF77_11815 [Clostridia bacterium BRH_c25]